MIRKPDLMIMNTENTVDDVLKRMGSKRSERVAFICDQEGKLTGLISKLDIKNAAVEGKHLMEAVHATSHGN